MKVGLTFCHTKVFNHDVAKPVASLDISIDRRVEAKYFLKNSQLVKEPKAIYVHAVKNAWIHTSTATCALLASIAINLSSLLQIVFTLTKNITILYR